MTSAVGPKPMVTTRELDAWHASIRREGACVGTVSGPDGADPWFPLGVAGKSDIRRRALEDAARKACGGCPVISECGRWAVATRQRYGVWGAMAEHEVRSAILADRLAQRRARRRALAETQALVCADETSTSAPVPVAPRLVEVVERGRSAPMASLCTTSAVAEVA